MTTGKITVNVVTKKQIKLAELSLIRAIPDMSVVDLKNGRLKGLYARLTKAVDKDLKDITKATRQDLAGCRKLVFGFLKLTGWEDNHKHIFTLLSFCSLMLEESQFRYNPNIQTVINELFGFIEQREKVKPICCWAGANAVDKWNIILEDAA